MSSLVQLYNISNVRNCRYTELETPVAAVYTKTLNINNTS